MSSAAERRAGERVAGAVVERVVGRFRGALREAAEVVFAVTWSGYSSPREEHVHSMMVAGAARALARLGAEERGRMLAALREAGRELDACGRRGWSCRSQVAGALAKLASRLAGEGRGDAARALGYVLAAMGYKYLAGWAEEMRRFLAPALKGDPEGMAAEALPAASAPLDYSEGVEAMPPAARQAALEVAMHVVDLAGEEAGVAAHDGWAVVRLRGAELRFRAPDFERIEVEVRTPEPRRLRLLASVLRSWSRVGEASGGTYALAPVAEEVVEAGGAVRAVLRKPPSPAANLAALLVIAARGAPPEAAGRPSPLEVLRGGSG